VIIDGLKSRNNVGQPPNQFRGQILVQQDGHSLALAVGHIGHLCRKRVDSREVIFLKAGMFVEDFLLSHPVREPAKDIIDRDPHATNARLAVPFVGLDRDARCPDVITRLWRNSIFLIGSGFDLLGVDAFVCVAVRSRRGGLRPPWKRE